MRGSIRAKKELARSPEEDHVESFVFCIGFLSFMVSIPIVSVLLGYDFFLGLPYGALGKLLGAIVVFVAVNMVMHILFSRRQRFSPDQFRMFAKILVIVLGVAPSLLLGFVVANDYVAWELRLTAERYHLFTFVVAWIELLCFFIALKVFFGSQIGRWYHMKPLSELGALKLVPKFLAEAEGHLKRKEFEGASQMYGDAAKMYLYVEDWKRAADYYWLAAETLAKDAADLRFGVAMLYTLSAAAYFLGNNVGKADEAVERTKEIAKDQKVNEGGKISLTLEILEVIKAENVQLMQEEPAKVVRILKDIFGPYGEEMTLLLEKNLDRLKQESNHR
jgi:hypothetical protein